MRTASPADLFDIVRLYTEFQQSEPIALQFRLGRAFNPHIAASLAGLAAVGSILLSWQGDIATGGWLGHIAWHGYKIVVSGLKEDMSN